MSEWRFHLLEVPSRVWIDKDVPLNDAEVTTVCSGPAAIRGNLPLGYPLGYRVQEWGTLLIAEQEGLDPVAVIVDRVNSTGDVLTVEGGGLTSYLAGMPWTSGEFNGISVDPLDMVRKIWADVQSKPGGNLGVVVDTLRSNIRIGTKETDVKFKTSTGDEVSFTTGPFKLNWWETDDLGRVVDDLAADTPFDFLEESYWGGDDITHRLRLGYPSLGSRRDNLSFEVGVNVTAPPPMADGLYASEVRVFGAGEGRKKVTSGDLKTTATGRLRRVHTVNDPAIRSKTGAQTAARPLLARLGASDTPDTLDVIEHSSAPFGTFGPGDTIYVSGDAGWAQLDQWVRIQSMTFNCSSGALQLKVSAT